MIVRCCYSAPNKMKADFKENNDYAITEKNSC